MVCTLTEGQIKYGSGSSTTNAQKFAPYIREVCEKYGIDTAVRQLCFLAQIGHESGGLFFTEEIASGVAYEGRKNLGNTVKGDGVKFKGRGLIQLTGRSNYKALSDAFGVDFIKNPTWLGGKNANVCTPQQLKYAAWAAGWYWSSRKLNDICDKININLPIDIKPNIEHFTLLTKKINGGTNGLNDRLSRYRQGQSFFK